MSEVTATEAARRFADLLDSVEHVGRRYTITRLGKAVASIEPVSRGRGSDVKALLRRHRPDSTWSRHLAPARAAAQRHEPVSVELIGVDNTIVTIKDRDGRVLFR